VGRVLGDAIQAVTGEPPAFEPCPGLLETRFYAARGVPAFAYGPGILAVSHGPKEFVKLTRVAECAEIYALCAARLLTS
jgi:succinyl-diaminopimelate desuccinylase